jgi:hypothetical protein
MKKLGPNERRLLRAGDAFDPPPEARSRMRKALAARLGAAALGGVAGIETSAAAATAGGADATATGAATTGAGWLAAPLVKVVAILAIGGAVAGGGVDLARRASAPQAPRSAAVLAPPPPASTALTSPAGSTSREPHYAGVGTDSRAVHLPDSGVEDVAPSAAQPSDHRSPLREPDQTVPKARVSTCLPPLHQSLAETAAPTGEAASAVRASRPIAAPPAIGAEAVLLRDVQLARTSGDPARALALVERYAVDHPRGALADVATTEHALALCALGRRTEARGIASSLLREATTSPLTARLKDSCAGELR